MPTLRRSRYLTCFYCGGKTSTRNDGSVRQFECPKCDATNYLDENGEITDPPLEVTAASTRTDPKPRFPGTAGSKASSDVFCAKCLKNQRLFTSSLAQYLPEDTEDPEYEERERNFYKYRKGLERQYPQVCADCEPKVLDRITQAGYTAKTDHLRRMIDRSRKVRTPSTATGLLGLVGGLGRYLWFAGFVLQGLWHLSVLRGLVSQHEIAMLSGFWGCRMLQALGERAFALLPSPERLMKWSILATAGSLWWNPFLVQTIRGFTKHLLGISTWYTYQAIIMFLRIMAVGIPNLASKTESELPMQLAAHSFMLVFIFLLSRLALASIRTDTTPLFATASKGPLPMAQSVEGPRSKEPTSMSDILDEVLATPASKPQHSGFSPNPDVHNHYETSPGFNQRPLWGQQTSPTTPGRASSLARPESRGLSGFREDISSQVTTQYDDEMDWTPTQSKHRAFSSFGSPEQPLRGFGQTPVEEGQPRQFWYKVPPAPTSIAQRALNPPTAARLRKQPAPAEKQAPAFGISFDKQGLNSPGESRADVAFKEPSFFPETTNDPRNTLSDLFGEAFSISPGRERDGARRTQTSGNNTTAIRLGSPSDVSLLLFSALLLIPGYESLVPQEYSGHLALSVCFLSLIIWVRVILDTSKDLGKAKPWILTPAVGAFLGLAELTIALRTALKVNASGLGAVAFFSEGRWLVGVLFLHQAWNAFIGPLVQRKFTGQLQG